MGLPTFHGMGILFQLCYPLCSSQAVVVNASQYPDPPVFPNPQSMYDLCKMTECSAVIALPSFIEVGLSSGAFWLELTLICAGLVAF